SLATGVVLAFHNRSTSNPHNWMLDLRAAQRRSDERSNESRGCGRLGRHRSPEHFAAGVAANDCPSSPPIRSSECDAARRELRIGRCGGGVGHDTERSSGEYAAFGFGVNVSNDWQPSRNGKTALEEALSMPEATRSAVGAQRRDIDGAEASATINGVM